MNEEMAKIPKSRILVFDTETTGLNPEQDEILQLSACDGYGKKLMDIYLQPETVAEWPNAEAVNHISPEMVKNAPHFSEVRNQVQEMFDRAELLVAYNGTFDLSFLRKAGIETGEKPMYDAMFKFAEVYGEWSEEKRDYKWQKLTKAADYYGFDWNRYTAHNSMSDVYATLFIFNKMTQAATRRQHEKKGMER